MASSSRAQHLVELALRKESYKSWGNYREEALSNKDLVAKTPLTLTLSSFFPEVPEINSDTDEGEYETINPEETEGKEEDQNDVNSLLANVESILNDYQDANSFSFSSINNENNANDANEANDDDVIDSVYDADFVVEEGAINENDKFPLKFCATRWIEDQLVADQAYVLWPSMVCTVKHWMNLCPSKRPQNNKSFDTLVEHSLDLLIPAKFQFFSFIAGILKPYLVIFQSDSPLLPFMFDELSLILYRLVHLIFKKKEVDQCKKLREVMNTKFLSDPNNQLEEYLIDIGAAAKDILQKVDVANEKMRKFRQSCKDMILAILLKLLERLPTNQTIVVAASSISPANMARIPSKAQQRFNILADNLYSLKFLTSTVADNSKFQYAQFLKNEVELNQDKFLKFDFRTDRVDSSVLFIGCN